MEKHDIVMIKEDQKMNNLISKLKSQSYRR